MGRRSLQQRDHAARWHGGGGEGSRFELAGEEELLGLLGVCLRCEMTERRQRFLPTRVSAFQ